MSAIQTEREMLSQREKQAFLDYLDESGMNDEDHDDPTVMQQLKDRLSEIWRGPAFGKREVLNAD